MFKTSFKIASSVILAGLFIIVAFMALNYKNLDTGIYIVFGLSAIYIFLFGFAIGQSYVSPIKKILEKAKRLSSGDLTSRVYIESKDEIGELAKIFNKLAEDLEQSHSTVEKTESSIDMKVKARTQALEETISALEQKVKNRTLELQKMAGDSLKMQEKMKLGETEIDKLKKDISSLKGDLNKNRKQKNNN